MQDTDLQDLQKDTFVVVVVLVAALSLVLFYIMLLAQSFATRGNEAAYQFWWLPSSLAFAVCLFSYQIYKHKHFRPATYVFIGGLTLAVVSFLLWPNSEFNQLQVYLLLLVVAMAGLLISPHAAAQAAAFAVIVTLGAVYILDGFTWPILRPLIAPLLMVGGMAIVGNMALACPVPVMQRAVLFEAWGRQRLVEYLPALRAPSPTRRLTAIGADGGDHGATIRATERRGSIAFR